MRFEDLQSESRYEAMEVYCRSKLANVLFTRELARRLDDDGGSVTVNAVHPGPVRSSFGMDGDLHGVMGFGMRLVRPFEISPKRGAKTSLHLATSPAVAGRTGEYWVRCKRGHMSRQARNDEAAAQLWDESERLLAGAGFAVA
jgi:NAD(P)-dependent dehydrogenase (short-subunit alcohol dehydrogenase family)